MAVLRLLLLVRDRKTIFVRMYVCMSKTLTDSLMQTRSQLPQASKRGSQPEACRKARPQLEEVLGGFRV